MLHDGFLYSSGQGIEIQSLVDFRQFGLRPSRFAHMQAATVGAAEGGGDAALHTQDVPQRAPAALNAVGSQVFANDLHELVGQHRDEQADQAAARPPR